MSRQGQNTGEEHQERRAGDPGIASDAAAVELSPSSGEASDEEVAAVVAALSVLRAKRIEGRPTRSSTRWRFSGRWWSKPVPLRRDRPMR
ncbi:MAG: hypothetical protein KatS3mg008_1258 [Acidimicrobiales bacterium]|nr:MAG: hypothetical protein KatS3mg008_1258 [Acidimicrobiales bacterium]